MEQMPIIKLEIDDMKYTILHYFNQHQEKVSKAVAAQIEKVISSYDYEGAVTKAATEVLDSAIESFVQVGEGRAILQGALNKALKNAFKPKKQS